MAPFQPYIQNTIFPDFMPFAPSILKEYAAEYYEDIAYALFPSKFMTITCRIKNEFKDALSAVTHIDSTARPHVVCEEINPSFHKILSCYKELTGFPVVLNTSFNTHNNPIVCSPKDAVRCFLTGCIDVLSIGNFILKQPGLPPFRDEDN